MSLFIWNSQQLIFRKNVRKCLFLILLIRYIMNVRTEEDSFQTFNYSMFLLFGSAFISTINSYRKLYSLKKKFSEKENSLEKDNTSKISCQTNIEVFSLKDKVIICMYHCLYKYLPEYSIQITDYISKIIGKSCKSLSLVIIMFLHRTPVIGHYLDELINESGSTKIGKLKFSDFVKATLNCISILLFAWQGYSWKCKAF